MKTLTPILLTLLFASLPISAQVYSFVDANGNTIYTDNPPKGQKTKVIDIPTTSSNSKEAKSNNIESGNNYLMPKPNHDQYTRTVKLTPQAPSNTSSITYNVTNNRDYSPSKQLYANKPYKNLTIIVPAPKATIANTGGQMMVQVKSQPSLASGDKYQFIVDNKLVSELASPALSLNGLERGEHILKVQIVDANGKLLIASEEQPFYIRQITLADRRRARPCELADYGVRLECPLKDKPPPEDLVRKIAKVIKETAKKVVTTAAETAIDSALP